MEDEVLRWAGSFAETVHFVASSCIAILGAGAEIGFGSRCVETGMAASPFSRRAVWCGGWGHPNMLRTDLEGDFWKFLNAPANPAAPPQRRATSPLHRGARE